MRFHALCAGTGGADLVIPLFIHVRTTYTAGGGGRCLFGRGHLSKEDRLAPTNAARSLTSLQNPSATV
jgi:hypothetical protein